MLVKGICFNFWPHYANTLKVPLMAKLFTYCRHLKKYLFTPLYPKYCEALSTDLKQSFLSDSLVEEALPTLEVLVAAGDDQGIFKHALQQQEQEKYEEALQTLAHHSDPAQVEVQLLHGYCLDALGKLEEAKPYYQRVQALAPDYQVGFENNELLTKLLPDYAFMERTMGLIDDCLDEHNFEEAFRMAEQLIAATPEHPQGYFSLGIVCLNTKDYLAALYYFEQAVELAPQNIQYLYEKANMLYHLEEDEEAVESFDQVIALAPHHLDARFKRSDSALMLSRTQQGIDLYASAIEDLDQVIAANPSLNKAHYNRAVAYVYGSKNYKKALEDLLVAEQVDAEDADLIGFIYYETGNCYHHLSEPDKACESWKKGVDLSHLACQNQWAKYCQA